MMSKSSGEKWVAGLPVDEDVGVFTNGIMDLVKPGQLLFWSSLQLPSLSPITASRDGIDGIQRHEMSAFANLDFSKFLVELDEESNSSRDQVTGKKQKVYFQFLLPHFRAASYYRERVILQSQPRDHAVKSNSF